MDHMHPTAVVGDIISGAAAWFSFTGFINEVEGGLLSQIAAGISILWFTVRFVTWFYDKLGNRHNKRCDRCQCDE